MDDTAVVRIGRMLGDPTRVALLDALFDGRAYTVTELSRHVGVARSTASEHLAKLLDTGLVAVEAQGRHRYYRLRDREVAETLEKVFELGHRSDPAATPVAATRVPSAMVYARSCYDHLAGVLAVALADHLRATGLIDDAGEGPSLTPSGIEAFDRLGLGTATTPARRPTVRACLDWSERRQHLAGALPAELLTVMLDRRWLRRRGSSRALELTTAGRRGLQDHLGFEPPVV